MKKILCFGDSNTWGYMPDCGLRYDKTKRWTGILQSLVGDKFKIIEAGCCNRTGFANNPCGADMTGYLTLPKYLDKSPDIVILAIGINDTQKIYNFSLNDINNGIIKLIEITKNNVPNAEIIIASPACINENIKNSHFKIMFDSSSIEKSKQMASVYKQVADDYGCKFVDWNDIVSVSNKDGLHLSEEAHSKIAHEMYKLVRNYC